MSWNWWTRPTLANPFLANPFLQSGVCHGGVPKGGAPKGGGCPKDGPKGGERGPKFRVFFSLSRHKFIEASGPPGFQTTAQEPKRTQMRGPKESNTVRNRKKSAKCWLGPSKVHVWALGLSCEAPVQALQTPKYHEKTPKRRKKGMNLWREREKKSEILGGAAEGAEAGGGRCGGRFMGGASKPTTTPTTTTNRQQTTNNKTTTTTQHKQQTTNQQQQHTTMNWPKMDWPKLDWPKSAKPPTTSH